MLTSLIEASFYQEALLIELSGKVVWLPSGGSLQVTPEGSSPKGDNWSLYL